MTKSTKIADASRTMQTLLGQAESPKAMRVSIVPYRAVVGAEGLSSSLRRQEGQPARYRQKVDKLRPFQVPDATLRQLMKSLRALPVATEPKGRKSGSGSPDLGRASPGLPRRPGLNRDVLTIIHELERSKHKIEMVQQRSKSTLVAHSLANRLKEKVAGATLVSRTAAKAKPLGQTADGTQLPNILGTKGTSALPAGSPS